MGLTHFPHGVSSYGVPVMGGGGIPATFGDIFFVDATDGLSGNDGKDPANAKALLSQAYTLATTAKDDLIILRGAGTIDEDSMLTWAKNKVHVIGVGGHGATDPEPRLRLSTTGISADAAANMKVTGWGNSFSYFRIVNWGTHANSVAALWDAGEATVYTGMQFCKFTDLNVAAVSDVEARGDSTTWRNCKFGFDTLTQSAARPTLYIKGTGGGARMKNNYFENCYWVCHSSSSSKNHVKIYDTNSLAFSNVMVNPIFLCSVQTSSSAVVLTDAVASTSGLAEGNLLLVNPSTNCTYVCNTTTDRVQVVGPLTHVDAGKPQTPS